MESRHVEGRRLTLDDAISIIVPVCIDLKARHDRGESHYVYPSAIVSGPDGIMRLSPELAVKPTDVRDRACVAPEVVRSNTPGNARASVFAVGAMLYEAVCGSSVGPGMRRPRDVEPSLPESFEHLLAKALVADPSHRPDDLGALASAMHQLAPTANAPPPDVDTSTLDRSEAFEVDVRLSLLPPEGGLAHVPPPSSSAGTTGGVTPQASASVLSGKDPTRQLATLKANLESDPRPRFVVNKERMDHGPFNAVELLQQIASHKFVGKDILRDELTGGSKAIDEWDEFAPFAQHARMHRDIAQEKKEVAIVEKAEKKAGAAKFIVGIVMAVALVAGGGYWLSKSVGSREDSGDIHDDPSAVDLSGGGSLKGGKKASGSGGKGGGGGGAGAGFVGGQSYEQALATNVQEIGIGTKSGPDLTDAQLRAPMNNAAFIGACGAPDSMKVTVKVAVKNGRAWGVTVSTNPPTPQVAACIDRHVRGLGWPPNAKMDSFVTTY